MPKRRTMVNGSTSVSPSLSDDSRGTPFSPTLQDWEELVNNVERIRASVRSLDRTITFAHASFILDDINRLIGHSESRRNALVILKERMTASELANRLNIDPGNLLRTLKPLIDAGYIVRVREGRTVFYEREEKVGYAGFDRVREA